MIVFDLHCKDGHRFEGWFASTDAFREQCRRDQVQCPHCQTSNVSQLPSAPHLVRGTTERAGSDREQATMLARMHDVMLPPDDPIALGTLRPADFERVARVLIDSGTIANAPDWLTFHARTEPTS